MKKTEIKRNFLILKIILFLLFFILLLKFLMITIYYRGGFESMAKFQTKTVIENPMPRGEIFDRNNNILAGNKEYKNLIYINDGNKNNQELWKLATTLSKQITTPLGNNQLLKVDYQDLIIRENGDQFFERLSFEEQQLPQEELDKKLRSKVTKKDYEDLVAKYGEKAIEYKIKMDVSSASTPLVLVKKLNKKDQYFVQSNLGKLGGCFVVDDWERTYPYKETFSGWLGTVGKIPEEEYEKYKSQGYGANELVGTSYIEKEMEPVLNARTQKIEIFFDQEGNIINYQTTDKGKEGLDIILTIDIKLQKEIENILKRYLKEDSYKYFKTAFSSVVNPNTGELLAVGGIYEDDKKYYDNSIGQITTAYEIGSVIKPAILGLGYDTGIWEQNTIINDAPLDFGGGTIKSSYHNSGMIDEFEAIKHSSNIYFYDILLKMANLDYTGASGFPAEVEQKYFDQVREELQRYGLGSKTGVGFNSEITGVVSTNRTVGLYADIANGQYDTYTPLALTQYVGGLANGTSRMKMNYLYSVNHPGEIGKPGREKMRVQPEILNKLPVGAEDMKHVQDTLAEPSKPGGTTNAAADSRYKIGSKSGTSESFYFEAGMKEAVKTDNASFIAYAPYNDPKIAVSVLFPFWTPDGYVNKPSATTAGAEILDALYDAGYTK